MSDLNLRSDDSGASPYALEVTPASAGWGQASLRVLPRRGRHRHLEHRHADSVALIQDHADGIGDVHIKQMDPSIVAEADAVDLALGQAVAMVASCEPPAGRPDVPSVVQALAGLGRGLFDVVEQDMYPLADFDAAERIATRTRDYPRGVGIGA